jgi:GLPGLI family protein
VGPDGETADRVPQQITERFELLFGNNRSLWQPLPDVAEEAAAASGNAGNTMRAVRFGGGADVVYCDLASGKKIVQSELRSRNYIVEDSLETRIWKLHDEAKEILGYPVKKATASRYGTRRIMAMENGKLSAKELPDTSTIVAWFAPDIPVAAGPDGSGGLPGLILELDENGGRSVLKAVDLSPKVALANLREPKGGKRISAAAFRTEQEKWMADIQQRMQSGGRVSMPLPPGN